MIHKHEKTKTISSMVKIDQKFNEREEVFNEKDLTLLYQAKCDDLAIKFLPHQFTRFMQTLTSLCYNRKCFLSKFTFGPKFSK